MRKTLSTFLFCFLTGGLYALAYPSFLGGGWFPLLFISIPLFLWKLERAQSFRQMALAIIGHNMGLNLVGYYWIPQTLQEFGQLPYAISLLLGLGFTFILQPHWWLYTLWKKWKPAWRWQSEHGVLITAFMMTFLERYFPQQFPSYAGSPWLHHAPYLGLAPIFGVVIFSFFTYWVSLEAVTQLEQRKFRSFVWVALIIFVVINALTPLRNPQKKSDLNVRLVQANIGNFLKVQSERGEANSYESISQKYFRLSTENLKEQKPDLIIWPETAYPNAFFGHHTKLDPIFTDIMKETGAEILIGGYDQDITKPAHSIIESVFNSSILLSDGKVKTSYHKNILIPFGETLPFGPFNQDIVSIVPAVSLFARGYGTPLMETKTGERFVTPICYEILESNFLRSLLNEWKDNHFIVNHTNDSWYGDTAEPYQHLFLSKWRALEFQLPIVRSTNTGISSVIYPDGSESERLGIGEEKYLDVSVPISKAQNTVYQIYGIYPLLGLLILLIGLTLLKEKLFR